MKQVIPLQNENQIVEVSLNIDGQRKTLGFEVRYNRTAAYWTMKVTDVALGVVLLDSVPLLTGSIGAANILGQYRYLRIGSAYLVKVGNVEEDYPGLDSLGKDFLLLWGDTPVQ